MAEPTAPAEDAPEPFVVVKFTRVDDATGRVLQRGTSMFTEGLAGPGESILPGVAPPNTYRRAGKFVAYPAQPSPVHTFNYATHRWVDQEQSERQAQKWEDIKAARAAANAAGVTVDGLGIFDTRSESVLRVVAEFATLDAKPDDWAIDWTQHERAGNARATLTKEQFRLVGEKILGFAGVNHAISQELRDRIDAAKTKAALAAIEWPTA